MLFWLSVLSDTGPTICIIEKREIFYMRNKIDLMNNSIVIYLASAGDIGGMMGKKFGLGWSLDLPVMRQ